jgi:hypothetical protein
MAEILNLLDSLPWDILDHCHTHTEVSAEGSLASSVLIDGCFSICRIHGIPVYTENVGKSLN